MALARAAATGRKKSEPFGSQGVLTDEIVAFMNILKSLCLGVVVAAGCAGGALAQTAGADINPASLYYQSFLLAPKAAEQAADSLYNWNLPQSFEKFVKGFDDQFLLIRRAAKSKAACDWGIDFSQGPSTPLPPLAQAKAAAVAMRYRVMWDLQNGRQTEACDDLLATYVLSRNVARDGTLISVLVQFANEAICYSAVTGNFGRFSPESLTRLVKGFEEAPPRRILAQRVASDKATCQQWVMQRVLELEKANPGDEKKVMAGIAKLFDNQPSEQRDTAKADWSDSELWSSILKASGGTSDKVKGVRPRHWFIFIMLCRL